MCHASAEVLFHHFDPQLDVFIQKSSETAFSKTSASSKEKTLFGLCTALWWISDWEPGSHIYLKLIRGKRENNAFPPEPPHANYDPTLFSATGPMRGARTMCFLVQVQALPRETENHYQLKKKKSSVIYRKWLEALYPASVVSCPQSPNHPHNLQFCGQRALTRQNKPFTLSQWRWILKSGVHCDCRQSLRRGQVGGVPRWRALPRRSLIFSKREG